MLNGKYTMGTMQVRLLRRLRARVHTRYTLRGRVRDGTGRFPNMLIQSRTTNNKRLFIKLSLIYLYTYLMTTFFNYKMIPS